MLDKNQDINLTTNTLNEEQAALLSGYNQLNADGKNLIMTMISQLNFGRTGQDTNDYFAAYLK